MRSGWNRGSERRRCDGGVIVSGTACVTCLPFVGIVHIYYIHMHTCGDTFPDDLDSTVAMRDWMSK